MSNLNDLIKESNRKLIKRHPVLFTLMAVVALAVQSVTFVLYQTDALTFWEQVGLNAAVNVPCAFMTYMVALYLELLNSAYGDN